MPENPYQPPKEAPPLRWNTRTVWIVATVLLLLAVPCGLCGFVTLIDLVRVLLSPATQTKGINQNSAAPLVGRGVTYGTRYVHRASRQIESPCQ